MSRVGHRPLVRAVLAWYRLAVDRDASEAARGRAYRAMLDAAKAVVERAA